MVFNTIKSHWFIWQLLITNNGMSNPRKEEQRQKDEDTTSTTATTTKTASQVQQEEEEQRQSINKAIDETRSNIRKAVDEARSQIPRYTQAANEYQEQTIQTTREIADNFLESQKEIINSFQSSWVPAIEKAYGVFWNYWMSPRRVTDIYARTVSNIADNTVAAARLVNNTVFSNLDAFKTCTKNTRDNLKELSRIGVNAARAFEQTSRDTTTATRSASFSS
jgi:vacuolar-type H+-ATPase subunit H